MCGTCVRRSKDCFYDPKKDKLQRLVDDFQRARQRIKVLEDSRETSHQAPNVPAPKSPISNAGKWSFPSQPCWHAVFMSHALRSLGGHRCAETPRVGRQQTETACSVLGVSVVSTSGWLELSRIFRINYASDLSFVHLPTLVDPYCSTFDRHSPSSDAHHAFDNDEVQPSNSSGLILALLALTFRHCRDGAEKCLAPGVHDMTDGMALSAHFANLANHWLVAHDAGKSCSHLERLQVRLMLATYNWSLGRCVRSRLLLSEAVSMASDLGILQGHHTDSGPSAISIAMAFEAESMGLTTEGTSRMSSDNEIDEEVARQIAWCCFLMDTKGSLGDRRSKIIQSTAQFPPLREDGATLTIDVNGQRKLSTASSVPQSSSASSDPASSPTSYKSAPILTRHLSADNDIPHRPDGHILNYYIHFVSLLYRIQKWTDSKPWR